MPGTTEPEKVYGLVPVREKYSLADVLSSWSVIDTRSSSQPGGTSGVASDTVPETLTRVGGLFRSSVTGAAEMATLGLTSVRVAGSAVVHPGVPLMTEAE